MIKVNNIKKGTELYNTVQVLSTLGAFGLLHRILEKPYCYGLMEPFTWEDRDSLRGKWIRKVSSGKEGLIVEFGKTTDGRLVVHTFTHSPSAEVLMEEFEFLDGTPCGKIL